MKRFITLLITAVLLVAGLTSCVCSNIGVTLNKNGTGSIATAVGIEKSAVDQIKALGGEDPFEGKTTTEQIIDGKTYVTVSETKEYGSYGEIKEALLAMKYETDKLDALAKKDEEAEADSDYTLLTPPAEEKSDKIFSAVDIDKATGIFYSAYSFHATVNAFPTPDIDPDIASQLNLKAEDLYKFTITVTMPEKITKSTDGKVEGKTVTFDLSNKTETTEIGAVAEANHYFVVFAIIIGLLVAVAVAVIVLKRKK